MRQKVFPDDSSGMVAGPDGPVRRTRAHVLAGYSDPVEERNYFTAREDAFLDEEGAYLNARLEDG